MSSQWSDQLTGIEDVTGDRVQSVQADAEETSIAEETSTAEHRIPSAESVAEHRIPSAEADEQF